MNTETSVSTSPEAALEPARRRLLAGDAAAALDECRGILESHPDDPGALHLSALAACRLTHFAAAETALQSALTARPGESRWWRDLSAIFQCTEDWPRARGALHRAIELDPDFAAAHAQLADLLRRMGQFEEALAHCRRTLELEPARPQAWFALANCLWLDGQAEDALQAYRKAAALAPDRPDYHSVLLSKLLYDASQTPQSLVNEYRHWARLYCPTNPTPAPFANVRDPERPLRIGYLTGSFTASPTYHFALPIIAHHDRAQFETYLYHSAHTRDSATAEFEQLAGHWRDVHLLADSAVEALVRRDAIDILVDLSGHYPGHRLPVFARRAAPVQATIPNYPATTGVGAIDYILTDEHTCPPGFEYQYVETALRLNTWYLPYKALAAAPDVTPLPCLARDGEITFGLIQRRTKLNPRVWGMLAEVLRRTPHSRLLIHFGWPNLDHPDDPVCHSLARELTSRGIGRRRILFRGARPLVDHLKLLSQIDLALDTFPYNGHTTTCECLWMGVPVVTLAGETHVSRVGSGILHQVGLDEFAARSAEEFAAIAERAARDPGKLAELRASLRARMQRGLDGRTVTREIERAYRWMWREWCKDNRTL